MAGYNEVHGHGPIIQNLKKTIKNNKVSHAYIFDGPKGIGKKAMANAFAKALECEAGNGEACGHCLSCRVFESGNHPDIFYVGPSKDRKTLGVDDIRGQICRNMEVKPFKYRYKVFIVEKASSMTPQAQNAMLKTIEDPAEYGIFIFLSENLSAFLPTVLSRCITFRFKPLPDSEVEAHLMETGLDREQARLAACFSQGNIGRAEEISSSKEFMEMRALAITLTQSLRRLDLPEIFAQFSSIEKYKDSIQDFLDLFIAWYRDVIAVKATGSTEFLMQADKSNEIYSEAQSTDLQSLYRKFDAVSRAKKSLRLNSNFQLTLEMMMLALR
jgi:DNA polymerase-3 subunit delta'